MARDSPAGLAERLLCRLTRHVPEEAQVWNDGFYFSRCVNCRRDILRRGGRWRPVPQGYRVVWKKRPEGYPDWNSVSRHIAEEQMRAGAESGEGQAG